jgi:predicted nucleic acid-binding Zn ribbon protein
LRRAKLARTLPYADEFWRGGIGLIPAPRFRYFNRGRAHRANSNETVRMLQTRGCKMKTLITLVTVLLGTCLFLTTGCESGTERESATNSPKTAQYTCPMHPEVVQNSPGKCPKCGMDLALKK